MAVILKPQRFLQQPQVPTDIDYSNSLTRNLIFAATPITVGPNLSVSTKYGIANIGSTIIPKVPYSYSWNNSLPEFSVVGLQYRLGNINSNNSQFSVRIRGGNVNKSPIGLGFGAYNALSSLTASVVFVDYTGLSIGSSAGYLSYTYGDLVFLVATFKRNTIGGFKIYNDNAKLISSVDTPDKNLFDAGDSVPYFSDAGGGTNNTGAPALFGAVWHRVLPPDEIIELYKNPWQVFKPLKPNRIIYCPPLAPILGEGNLISSNSTIGPAIISGSGNLPAGTSSLSGIGEQITTLYVGSDKWAAIATWSASTNYSVGDIVRQTAPAAGSERAFRCTNAGLSGATEPTWLITAFSTTSDNAATWVEVTGRSAYTWNAAHARLSNAFAAGWGAVGNTFLVSHGHAETNSTSLTLTSPGTVSNPCRVICINTVSSELAISASITITGVSGLVFVGSALYYGITFIGSSGSTTPINITPAAHTILYFKNCLLKSLSLNSATTLSFGAASLSYIFRLILDNTSIYLSADTQKIIINACNLTWKNTSDPIQGTALISGVFNSTLRYTAIVELNGLNLTALSTNYSIISSIANVSKFDFRNCKMPSNYVINSGAISGPGGIEIEAYNCDTDIDNAYYKADYQGQIVLDTTIYRSNGWYDQTTRTSKKMTTLASTVCFENPLTSSPITLIPASIGSPITITIHTVTDNITLTNEEAWLEVEYPGNTNSSLSAFASDSRLINASALNQDASTETWVTTGIVTPVKQCFVVTVTPVEYGPIRLTVNLAKASTTMWYCPKAEIS